MIRNVLIAFVVALWGLWLGVVVLGVVKFDKPVLAPVSVALVSMLAFALVVYILAWFASDKDMPKGGEY